jgi:hypothetical protein
MLGFERGALAGRGPPPGLKDIGIREGTFRFLLCDVVAVADVGCGAVGVGRKDDGVGEDTVACEVVGEGDGAGVVDDVDVAWWGCDVTVGDS